MNLEFRPTESPLVNAVLAGVYRKDFGVLDRVKDEIWAAGVLDHAGRTALVHAILDSAMDESMIEYLLRKHVPVNLPDAEQKWTALHFAARDHKDRVLRLLIDYGAAVDPIDIFGNTPLWRACFKSQDALPSVQLLLSKGADPNKKNLHGVSPLELAVSQGASPELVKILTARS